jgi:hypothetical protein
VITILFLSPLGERLGEGVNAKVPSCIAPSPSLSPKGERSMRGHHHPVFIFLSPLEERLGEGVNAKILSCITPSPSLSPNRACEGA